MTNLWGISKAAAEAKLLSFFENAAAPAKPAVAPATPAQKPVPKAADVKKAAPPPAQPSTCQSVLVQTKYAT